MEIYVNTDKKYLCGEPVIESHKVTYSDTETVGSILDDLYSLLDEIAARIDLSKLNTTDEDVREASKVGLTAVLNTLIAKGSTAEGKVNTVKGKYDALPTCQCMGS
jgi:hypothetical protein